MSINTWQFQIVINLSLGLGRDCRNTYAYLTVKNISFVFICTPSHNRYQTVFNFIVGYFLQLYTGSRFMWSQLKLLKWVGVGYLIIVVICCLCCFLGIQNTAKDFVVICIMLPVSKWSHKAASTMQYLRLPAV